jgi:acetylornithine deacetylase/succinyl-diaminopimelate desuccinylase-like protein
MINILRLAAPLAALLIGSATFAQDADPATQVSEARLRADIDTLVAFGTRHTLSDQVSETRGIGAARRWAEAEFRRISADCDNCLTIALPEEMVSGARVPTPTRLVNVLAIQRGTERPNEVVIISGHIDSRVTDPMDATSAAPGANDDGSGTVAVIEAARVLSRQRYPTTIVYAVLSGEEQGLYGGRLLAAYAAQQGWTVKALLNNDIIGGSRGSDGLVDDTHVRVFSEGARADSTDAVRAAARREGGENDSPSRNLSRYIASLGAADLGEGRPDDLIVRQVWRADRFGRGGDQLPSQEAGYPAVRFSVAIEDYEHQHQDVRTENGTFYGDVAAEMDFRYLAGVTRLNVRVLAALARAPMPPAPRVEGAVSTDTVVRWNAVPGADGYVVFRRRTDERDWSNGVLVVGNRSDSPQTAYSHRLVGVRVDDWVFGVMATAGGFEGPVASAVPGGAFVPLTRPMR